MSISEKSNPWTFAWLEQLPVGFALVDGSGKTLWLNSTARRLVGADGYIDPGTLERALSGARAVSDVELADRVIEITAAPVLTSSDDAMACFASTWRT